MDIEELKALAALPGDVGRNELAFWLADHVSEIIGELEDGRRRINPVEVLAINCQRCGADRMKDGCKNPSPTDCLFAGTAHDAARKQET